MRRFIASLAALFIAASAIVISASPASAVIDSAPVGYCSLYRTIDTIRGEFRNWNPQTRKYEYIFWNEPYSVYLYQKQMGQQGTQFCNVILNGEQPLPSGAYFLVVCGPTNAGWFPWMKPGSYGSCSNLNN